MGIKEKKTLAQQTAPRFNPEHASIKGVWAPGANGVVACFFLVLLVGCARPAPTSGELLTREGVKPLPKNLDALIEDRSLQMTFHGALQMRGVTIPTKVKRGETVNARMYFQVIEQLSGNPKIFVHGQLPGAERNQIGADHAPTTKGVSPMDWRVGDVIEDQFSFQVPADFPADRLLLMVGLYEGKKRYAVSGGPHDGKNRVRLAELQIIDGPPSFPVAKAMKVNDKMIIDGKMDEAVWSQTQRLGPFIRHDGKRGLRNPTYARIAWSPEYLYVFFECADTDIHTPYSKRDDPLYESEAVEIFIDADGDQDVYVELQAAPNDAHFDAAFKGGRRKNFETAYNVNYESKAVLTGTLNDPSDQDEGWTSEWKIPVKELRDVPFPIEDGATWKINLFRLDRIRRGDRVVGSEASAWSSPYSGDFHNLNRFGTLQFVAGKDGAQENSSLQ